MGVAVKPWGSTRTNRWPARRNTPCISETGKMPPLGEGGRKTIMGSLFHATGSRAELGGAGSEATHGAQIGPRHFFYSGSFFGVDDRSFAVSLFLWSARCSTRIFYWIMFCRAGGICTSTLRLLRIRVCRVGVCVMYDSTQTSRIGNVFLLPTKMV